MADIIKYRLDVIENRILNIEKRIDSLNNSDNKEAGKINTELFNMLLGMIKNGNNGNGYNNGNGNSGNNGNNNNNNENTNKKKVDELLDNNDSESCPNFSLTLRRSMI